MPVCSGRGAVRAFQKIGYELDHQTGSHMILRHMGEFSEAGAKGGGHLGGIHTPEACALHFADDADAQVKEFLQEVDAGRGVEKEWYYSPQMKTLLYLK